MLEHLPHWLGHALRNLRAGGSKLVIVQPEIAAGEATIQLSSPAFADGARMPARFTADGEGVSPPLVWGPLPEGTAQIALIVEDPDAPALQPLVHAVVWGIPGDEHRLAEGAICADGGGGSDGRDVGRTSFLREGWLPPDPPNGHGAHAYAFQLFALDAGTPDPGVNPGRTALIRAMTGHVLGSGLLIGLYERGPQPVGRVGARRATA